MNKNQILNPKTHKYAIYGFIALTIIMLLLFLASCDSQPTQPSYAQQQAFVQQPIEYENEVHHYYNNDNTAANLAAAAAVGAAAGYATNKYMDKQKQKQTTVLAPSKVSPVTMPVTKRITTTSKPTFSYTTSKPSYVYRSSRRK